MGTLDFVAPEPQAITAASDEGFDNFESSENNRDWNQSWTIPRWIGIWSTCDKNGLHDSTTNGILSPRAIWKIRQTKRVVGRTWACMKCPTSNQNGSCTVIFAASMPWNAKFGRIVWRLFGGQYRFRGCLTTIFSAGGCELGAGPF